MGSDHLLAFALGILSSTLREAALLADADAEAGCGLCDAVAAAAAMARVTAVGKLIRVNSVCCPAVRVDPRERELTVYSQYVSLCFAILVCAFPSLRFLLEGESMLSFRQSLRPRSAHTKYSFLLDTLLLNANHRTDSRYKCTQLQSIANTMTVVR